MGRARRPGGERVLHPDAEIASVGSASDPKEASVGSASDPKEASVASASDPKEASVGSASDPNEAEREEPLHGGDLTQVVRVGDTVRRTTGFWTPAVHSLLRYLEEQGFDGAPRALGIDEAGREVLTFLPGESVHLPHREWSRTDEVLAELGSLLRRYHDVVRGFHPPPDARWRYWVGAPREGIVCHTDLTPENVIFRDGRVAGFIDWDFAAPAPPLFDVASVAKFWVPLTAPARAAAEGWPEVPRGPRLRLLCDSYGLVAAERAELLAMCLLKQQTGYASHEAWAAHDPGFRRMWEEGSGPRMAADMAWLRDHWADLREHLR